MENQNEIPSLRTLRLRLAWTRGQLVRYLGCEVEQIIRWEALGFCNEPKYRARLEKIYASVEENSRRVQLDPQCEAAMEERHLVQLRLPLAA